MDSFTERMVERAQKRKERLKTHLKAPVIGLTADDEIQPLKDSVALNVVKSMPASDEAHNGSKIAPKGILPQGVENTPIDKTLISNKSSTISAFDRNSGRKPAFAAAEMPVKELCSNSSQVLKDTGTKASNPPKSSKDISFKSGRVLGKANAYEASKCPKKSSPKDPCELSMADRKALFEKNKGQALLPKVPFSQPLPARKKEEDKPPLKLPPKPSPKLAVIKQNGHYNPAPEYTMPPPSDQPPPPPPKPDHLRAFMEKLEADKKAVKNKSASSLDHKEQDTSYESIASSESSLGQKIVRLAQKRNQEIDDRKKQQSMNLMSASECELNFCGRSSGESACDIRASGPTPPKQYRSDSSETLATSNSDLSSSEKDRQNQDDDSKSEQPITHTVSFYRKVKNQNDAPGAPLVKKVVHQSVNSMGYQPSAQNEKLEKEAVNKKIAELQQKISAETTAISQAIQALNLCSSTIEFNESAEQIEAERLLLLATHRRQAAMNEVQRLKVEGTVKANKPNTNNLMDQGSLTVSEITLPVKFDAIQIAAREEKCHHFVCLLKCDEQVLGTSMITATTIGAQQTSKGIVHLQFPNTLTFPKLDSDFKVTIEIYDLLTRSKEALPHDVKYRITNKKDLNKFRITPKKQKVCSKLTAAAAAPSSGPAPARVSKFSMVGYIVFSLREVQRTQFTLNKVTYSNPLDGKMQLKLSCELSPSVERRGFLTMFEDVSGFGAWHRRWCLLKGDSLSYWKYPDDERTKLPIDTIDLNTCTAQTITAVNRDICARPNTFLLETIRPARDEDVDSLVLVRHSAHTMVRYLLSTDTKEERVEWCATLNKALDIIRAWRRK